MSCKFCWIRRLQISCWNGHICKNPCANTYCIGQHSYPGTAVVENRDVEYEKENAGQAISKHPCKVACSLSANAFGSEEIKAIVKKPSWWKADDAVDAEIVIPPYTACTWQYDAMYNGDVAPDSGNAKYDNNKRFENSKTYFKQFEEGKSLVFYYAGLSNPFSEEDNENFVIVGISRLKKIHDYIYYGNPSPEICEKYANGLVWQRPITSNYPDEGFCIPYWKYASDPDILERLVIKPRNREPFKYASREVPPDDAIDVVNQLIVAVDTLISVGDDTENWSVRKAWLSSILNELWAARGPFPGLPSVMEVLGFNDFIKPFLDITNIEEIKKFHEQFSEMLLGKRDDILGTRFPSDWLKSKRQNFQLLGDDYDSSNSIQDLILQVLTRIDLNPEQMKKIIAEDRERAQVSITATHKELLKNPYLLFEQYVGIEPGDTISFYKIDNGMIPSPNYGLKNFIDVGSIERLKALCVDELNKIPAHSFGKAETVLNNITERLDRMPEWKRAAFKLKHFSIEPTIWRESLYLRRDGEGTLYLYLKDVYEDERTIEKIFKELAERPDIQLKLAISKEKFIEKLKNTQSSVEAKAPAEYEAILDKQAEVCMQIFTKPICVLSGAAGTGKTTVIQALLNNISRIDPASTFLLMAPTGKATERIKNQTDKPSTTIHSYLAKNGWINENFTFKKTNGIKSNSVNTLIIDECSMIDLNLFATLIRAINWNSVSRLILVGDPNQLPAIGRGRVFADAIEWLKKEYPQNVGVLTENVRQLVNRVEGNGNGILQLANIFIQERQKDEKNGSDTAILKMEKETILKKIQSNGNGDIDKDLSVYFWKDQAQLEALLKIFMIEDMRKMTGRETVEYTPEFQNKLWQEVLKGEKEYTQVPERMQIITPYRGEFYGSDALNLLMQGTFNNKWASRFKLEGITIYDKVIQKINRPKSNMALVYDFEKNEGCEAEVYNGEIGIVGPHPYDKKSVHYMNRLQKFSVKFSNKNKQKLLYNYGKVATKLKSGKFIKDQSVEENLELAYAISVHKSQGSEFEHVYIVIPNRDSHLLSMELLYTALTRAQKKVTLFLQDDIGTLTSMGHVEKSAVRKINSSVFTFNPLPEVLLYTKNWHKENVKLATLSQYRVRSKSEVIIANMLSDQEIYFEYETPLYAPDGTMYLPDFTVTFRGEQYYWEHLGMLDKPEYAAHWKEKEEWYNKHFPGKLLTTREGNDLTIEARNIITEHR